ncbi:EAL domain-containing protein [Demequina zhanjiangensis]|uniref:EAL domain-containing protein n=1 Tax=Demequina zhanjiangensis TaxID=3051659 RepID=A0ABT8G1B8_9MICO|nr:EAL domain-containing protein [Demequina sp. SYSU T00b26]MDN4472934.1 EAL domain-containing protein [Demequina sp. SYSU T00b26]
MLGTTRLDARWTALLDDAIAGHGVGIHVQPVVDLSDGRVIAYEALARFQHDEAVGAAPDVWFSKARDRGLVSELQASVLRVALGLLPTRPDGAYLGLNVEPDTLARPETREALLDHADLTGVVVELTEHARWSWAEIEPTVAELRRRGALTAIDDAGTGYAVIEQIAELAPATLKLDRSIVTGVAQDAGKQALVDMIVGLARRAGAVLVGEGVERLADARYLTEHGVTFAQGFLLAAPSEPWPEPDATVVGTLRAAAAA